jgi:bidirectional [NiFe] hydrogenase diaphorase subunit
VPDVLNRAAQIGEANKEDPRVKKILKVLEAYRRKPDGLIQVLHSIQDLFGYVPLSLIALTARELRVAPSRVYGVATFYHFFSLKPKGEHNCLICTGTACYVKGAQKLIDQVQKDFKIKPGQSTPGNKLGLEAVRCIGACSLAPAVVMDNEIHARMTPENISGVINMALK